MTKQATWFLVLASACGGGSEAVQVQLPVVSDARRIETFETDVGYAITLTMARAAVRDLELTIEGEEHETGATVWHPGHAAGGEVTGELRGDLVVDFLADGAALGTATLLTGPYEGANFTFRRAGAGDGLDAADPLLGHTFHVELVAERDGQMWTVTMALDLDDGARLEGAPFPHEVTEASTETLGLQLTPVDPFEGSTLLDGIDLAPLDGDGDGAIAIEPGQTAHNQIRRLLGAHDYYYLEPRSSR